MNTLATLSLEMRRISQRLHEGEVLLSRAPESHELIAGQIADRNLIALLRREFDRAAARLGRPVARYSITGAGAIGYDMGAVGAMLTGYRHLYGLTRTAIETGLKIDTFDHHSPFSLGWGYIAEGAGLTFGMIETVQLQREMDFEEPATEDDVLTVAESPQPRDLVAETTRLIAGMARSGAPKELEPFVNKLGRGPIRALSAWANAHAESGSGVDAEWSGSDAPALRRAAPQIENLAILLRAKAKEERPVRVEVLGVFLGGYADTRRFRFQGEDGKVYHGRVDRGLNERPKGYPAYYKAVIEIRRGTRQATDEAFEEHKLLELHPAKG